MLWDRYAGCSSGFGSAAHWKPIRDVAVERDEGVGKNMAIAKKAAPTRPHPRTPAKPGVLKTAGVAAAAVDQRCPTVPDWRAGERGGQSRVPPEIQLPDGGVVLSGGLATGPATGAPRTDQPATGTQQPRRSPVDLSGQKHRGERRTRGHGGDQVAPPSRQLGSS